MKFKQLGVCWSLASSSRFTHSQKYKLTAFLRLSRVLILKMKIKINQIMANALWITCKGREWFYSGWLTLMRIYALLGKRWPEVIHQQGFQLNYDWAYFDCNVGDIGSAKLKLGRLRAPFYKY